MLISICRRLLDADLAAAIDDPTQLANFADKPLVTTMVQLLENDGAAPSLLL